MGNSNYAGDRRGRSRIDREPASSPEATRDGARPVRVTLQFRERHNMTYELDCAGIPLVVRMFFAEGDGPDARVRAEARAGYANGFSDASAIAPTRALALESIARGWRETAAYAVLGIDWDGVKRAMTTVRAI